MKLNTLSKSEEFNPEVNYKSTMRDTGYKPLSETTPAEYHKLGFKSGLEVHQQLLTEKKLFCNCPAGIYQKKGKYDAELVRHMRPTLSELGEYDGTALMEFKTRKNVYYRIANRTTCTYDIDDTPPFKINHQALEQAIAIAMMLKSNVVGELHVTRKQYLDGSIPTGFQRTGIVGIEGEIVHKNGKINVIQISIEEDSCREISDIRHDRIYTTDRLGMPLIEIVTYPEMKTPMEVAETAQFIRFLTRSTGHVRTGIGAAREDVNVSITGGTRVEIKGVSKITLIPKLTHNEAFRQISLLQIADILNNRIPKPADWQARSIELNANELNPESSFIQEGIRDMQNFVALNLPDFKGLLSYFNQPGRMFSDEISDRLKVIACIEKPNMLHSEEISGDAEKIDFRKIRRLLKSKEGDAQIIIRSHPEDLKTAVETVQERCMLAFSGVPNETRKSLPNGCSIFERVLPGPDRMYPDTDSGLIAIDESLIKKISRDLPLSLQHRMTQLADCGVPEDTVNYLLKMNFVPLMERIISEFDENPKFLAVFLGHRFKSIQYRMTTSSPFSFDRIYDLFEFIHQRKLNHEILFDMLPVVYQNPSMELNSVMVHINYQRGSWSAIQELIPILVKKYDEIKTSRNPEAVQHWIMRELRKIALGDFPLSDVMETVIAGVTNE